MKRKYEDWLLYTLVAIIIGGLAAFGIWWEWGLWQECRSLHSFFYCARVLGG